MERNRLIHTWPYVGHFDFWECFPLELFKLLFLLISGKEIALQSFMFFYRRILPSLSMPMVKFPCTGALYKRRHIWHLVLLF